MKRLAIACIPSGEKYFLYRLFFRKKTTETFASKVGFLGMFFDENFLKREDFDNSQALMMGSVPVVLSSPLDILYEELLGFKREKKSAPSNLESYKQNQHEPTKQPETQTSHLGDYLVDVLRENQKTKRALLRFPVIILQNWQEASQLHVVFSCKLLWMNSSCQSPFVEPKSSMPRAGTSNCYKKKVLKSPFRTANHPANQPPSQLTASSQQPTTNSNSNNNDNNRRRRTTTIGRARTTTTTRKPSEYPWNSLGKPPRNKLRRPFFPSGGQTKCYLALAATDPSKMGTAAFRKVSWPVIGLWVKTDQTANDLGED